MNGITTRKIDRLAKRQGIENISASQVSEINKGLDEMVTTFRTRRLEAEYPDICIDALYERIYVNNHAKNKAIMVVSGINLEEVQQILEVERRISGVVNSNRQIYPTFSVTTALR